MNQDPLVGRRFGRLTVIAVERDHNGLRLVCVCDCGTRKSIAKGNVLHNTTSCGCLRREVSAARQLRHGESRRGRTSAEYWIWSAIVQRCTNPNNRAWSNYGGRGIRVARRWLLYKNFIADVGRRPSPKLTIERVNNDAGYEPGNVVWATRSENNKNRRGWARV